MQAFAGRLGHDEAIRALERPFVHYVGNRPSEAERHYYGLREALPALKGVALFDRLENQAQEDGPLRRLIWKRREIENYFCTRTALNAYARESAAAGEPMPLFTAAETDKRLQAMNEAIDEIEKAMETLGRGSPWGADAKVSDDFLAPLFGAYFRKLRLPNLMSKKSFYELARHVPENEMDPEIREKLDAIAQTAESATAVP